MYITRVKTMVIEGLRQTFDQYYPVTDFQKVHIDMEYPIDPQQYPSIWLDYEDTQDLAKVGISHVEHVNPDTNTAVAAFTRYKFAGYISLTVVALTSLERDRLYDEMVRVIAFGDGDPILGRFKTYITTNGYIAMNINTDTMQPRGGAAAPGTPWSTDELMYERTLNLEVIGEFIPDPATATLVNLSKIQLDTPTIDMTLSPALSTELGVWH